MWVVKSQVHAGGRGKGAFKEKEAGEKGGVRLARSIEEVQAHVRQMLGNTLVTHQTGPAGKQVNRIYIEDGSEIARELYLSALVDRVTGRIAFVASTEGGMDIEEVARKTPEKIVTFSVDPATGIMPHHGRLFARTLRLTGDLAKQGEQLLTALFQAFTAKDMSLLEINPLVLTRSGQVICLDAKINFDGKGLTLLTPEDADHSVELSPSGRYFVDSYSKPDVAPVTVLRDSDGKVVMPLERADISRLEAAGWKPPMPFTVKARDGKTDLYGLMFRPTNFDPSKRYPTVFLIHGGPQGAWHDNFHGRWNAQMFASQGAVVFLINPRGSTGYGQEARDKAATLVHSFERYLPEHKDEIDALARYFAAIR